MEIIIGKKYKYISHSCEQNYIRVDGFSEGFFYGMGFYKNSYGLLGMGNNQIFNPEKWKKISDEEFSEELTKIEQEIANRFYKD